MKIIRTSTVSGSLNTFCNGLLRDLKENEGYEIIAVASPDEALNEIQDREGVTVYGVPMERRMAPLKDIKSLFKLIKIFRREKPDLVHSITPKAGLLSMLASWICRVPVRLHTFTGLVFPTTTGIKQRILILTDRLTCACATHIVPEGEGVKNDLLTYNITHKHLQVLGFGNIKGINTERFNPADPSVQELADKIRKENIFTYIFIGRLVGDKGINELVNAFTKLNLKYPNTRLILVGEKEQTIDPLNPNTIKTIDTNTSIEAVGRQKDVRPWLLGSDVLVFPSYREGFPNVVIEAGAMGKPAIVTDINGSREIIIEDKNGTIIPPKDTDALYLAMEKAYLNPDVIKKWSSNSRSLIKSRFEESYVRNCLKAYYRKILKRENNH